MDEYFINQTGCRYAFLRRISAWDFVTAAYHWGTWFLLFVVLIAQLLAPTGINGTSKLHMLYGQDPKLGLVSIEGQNDEPYSDRGIVCMSNGNGAYYKPEMLSQALNDISAEVVDTSGESISGYRVIKRNKGLQKIDPEVYDEYVYQCSIMYRYRQAMYDSCKSLGYNISTDGLRIVEGINSKETKVISSALPILLMPFWDNALSGLAIIPGEDGNACISRVYGQFLREEYPNAVIRSVDRKIRHQKTEEWIGKSGGQWRNGWYEEKSGGQKWHSQIITSALDAPSSRLGVSGRTFDGKANREVDCTTEPKFCKGDNEITAWSTKLASIGYTTKFEGCVVSNGTRYGVFIYEAFTERWVETVYDLETFLANISMAFILFRWMICTFALINGYRQRVSSWYSIGLGSVSCAKSFNMIPIMMAPRLKMLLAALWTCGGEFEGAQVGLSESWFVMYPSIAAVLVLYFSVLNIVAKIFYRRMTDAFFTPTLLFFFILHRFRFELGATGWYGFDSRISTQILSSEFETLPVSDFFFSNAAYRMNGNVSSLLIIKLIVLGLNLIPLVLGENMTTKGKKYVSTSPCDVERSLALRASNVGGLGKSCVYELDAVPTLGRMDDSQSNNDTGTGLQTPIQTWTESWMKNQRTDSTVLAGIDQGRLDNVLLNSVEIIRLGYLVFGGEYLVSFDDWYIISSLAPLRFIDKLWNHRITVFKISAREDGFYISSNAELSRVDDPRLQSIPFYKISACSFK